MRFSIVFVCAVFMLGQSIMSQDRVAKLVELNHVLGNLDDSFYSGYIGISDDQKKAIDALRKNVENHVSNVMIPRDQIKDPVQFKKNWKLAIEAVERVEVELSEVLLPSQMLLYKQREFQANAQLFNDLNGFTSDHLVKQLSLTDKQKNEIKTIVEKFSAEVSDLNSDTEISIQRVIEQSAKDSLNLLNSEQRKEYHARVGNALPKKNPSR